MGECRNSKHIYQRVPLSPHGDLKSSPILQSANDVPDQNVRLFLSSDGFAQPTGCMQMRRGRKEGGREGGREQANGGWGRKERRERRCKGL